MNREEIIKKLEYTKTITMSAKELFDKLGKIIADGKGDAMVMINNDNTGKYCLGKDANVEYVESGDVELYGAYVSIG